MSGAQREPAHPIAYLARSHSRGRPLSTHEPHPALSRRTTLAGLSAAGLGMALTSPVTARQLRMPAIWSITR